MKHIPSETLEKLRKILLDQRAKLTNVRAGVDEENPVNDTTRVNDNASPDADASEEVAIISSEVFGNQVNDSLARVDAALKHMDDGTYGIDSETGEPIPVERLLVDPTATRNVQKS